MLSLFSIMSAPSSPTASAHMRVPEPLPREPLTGIIADASKYEVTIVRYMDCPEDEDYDSDNSVDERRSEQQKTNSSSTSASKQDWDEKDWDEDAAEWTGPDW